MKVARLCAAAIMLSLVATLSWAANETSGVKAETTALYQKYRDQVAQLASTPAAKYAPEIIEQAKAQIDSAQNGLKQGNDRATREAAELAGIQVKLALATTDERIAIEKTKSNQNELAQLEQRLAAILAGKGEKP
jgi:exonuclease VII large subunit